ncbi:DEAD/DEAH box helicase [Novosphingobium sp. AP12]|uniref:DEAD/DEAH box helicase n=1 Tax=Novosphingobium sp. AP12 TaxID=1144305 RepID=UPI000272197E|nr:DEAD/DEAH box helicase [Novosphingobium sp. AP12]EJL33737.1 DNA/RNA helicase, superfamily II, SNF2 family [Novosphingobium sp. AP12]
MIPPVTDELLFAAVQTERMVYAGQEYFLQGRVSDLQIDPEFSMVAGIVRGSGKNGYFASIVFDDEEYDGFPDSQCTCPVGEACKHIAALLFALRNEGPPIAAEKPRLTIMASAQRTPQLSGSVGEWLNAAMLDELRVVQNDSVIFAIEQNSLFKSERTERKNAPVPAIPPRFHLQIQAWHRGKGEPSWHTVRSWELERLGAQIDPVAQRLLARTASIAGGGDFGPNRVPHGRHGWQWLREAAHAGMLRMHRPDGPAVSIAASNLQMRLCWQTLEDGRQIVDLEPNGEDSPDQPVIFAGDPPVFYDPAQGELGLIETDVAPVIAGRLLAMPPIGAVEIAALASRWERISGGALPPPALSFAEELSSITPRPVLRFIIDKVKRHPPAWDWRSRARMETMELVRLEFDYAGHRIGSAITTPEVIVTGPAGPTRILRNLEAEQAAVDRLARTSLLPIVHADALEPKPAQAWDHGLIDGEAGRPLAESFPDFLINDVTALRAEGWLIEYAPKWPHVYLAPDELASDDRPSLALVPNETPQHARDSAIDWFDVELAAQIEGQRVDVLPALRRVLAGGGSTVLEYGDDHLIPLPIGGSCFTAVRLGAVRPLIEALLRLALTDRDASKLKLSPHDLGIVHELAGTGLPWTSEDKLQILAKALHDVSENKDNLAFVPPGLAAELRAYQLGGCAWMQALHGAGMGGILADDMGLGKTLQAIAHILYVRQQRTCRKGPILIVAPTSVLPNWQAELARFAPNIEFLLWHGPGRYEALGERLADAEILLTSYPLLARDDELLAQYHYELVVLDEAHVLKNPKTAGFKAASSLKAKQVIALTGTPVENRLTDLWSLASLTNPGLSGTFDSFRKTYRTPIEKHGDANAKASLGRRMRPFMLRRTKDEVASELPPKTIISERIEFSEAQLRLYESQRLLMQARVREEIDRVGLMRSQIIVLDAMLKLRQICCDPALLPRELGIDVPSAKRARLLEMLDELVEEGRRVIVFSQFTTMLDLIAKDLDRMAIRYEQLRGTTRNRARPVERFQSGAVPLILVSLKAGGAGINLTAADTVILYDPWWNPAVEAQAIDRAHRIGQAKPVFVHRLIATGTIEEKILALQGRKQDLANVLWDDTAQTGSTALTDEDIAFLLG